jgi:hypothetical protein
VRSKVNVAHITDLHWLWNEDTDFLGHFLLISFVIMSVIRVSYIISRESQIENWFKCFTQFI